MRIRLVVDYAVCDIQCSAKDHLKSAMKPKTITKREFHILQLEDMIFEREQ